MAVSQGGARRISVSYIKISILEKIWEIYKLKTVYKYYCIKGINIFHIIETCFDLYIYIYIYIYILSFQGRRFHNYSDFTIYWICIVRRLFGKEVPSAHISRTCSKLSLCACAVTSSINWEATDPISWNSCYIYVCSCALNMFKTIEWAADCVMRTVIRLLNARNVLPSEIHHHICQVYGDNVMSGGMVRKWVRMFNELRENTHDEARSGLPFLVKLNFQWAIGGFFVKFCLILYCTNFILYNFQTISTQNFVLFI